MATVRFKLNHGAFVPLTYTAGMRAMLSAKAAAVLAAAQSASPVASGHYRESFRVAFTTTDRNVIRVHNDAEYATTVEHGGSRSAKYRPLGRGLDAAK